MPNKPYGSICALSKACDVIEPRWTLLILNQMWSGYSRFSDLRRAVGNISPGVLSKRLTEMERMGLIERVEDRARGTVDYVRTQKALDLEPAMDALSIWAQRNIEAEVALAQRDLCKRLTPTNRSQVYKPRSCRAIRMRSQATAKVAVNRS